MGELQYNPESACSTVCSSLEEAPGSRVLLVASLCCVPMAKSRPGECRGAQAPSYHCLSGLGVGVGKQTCYLPGLGIESRTPAKCCNRGSFYFVSQGGSFASPVSVVLRDKTWRCLPGEQGDHYFTEDNHQKLLFMAGGSQEEKNTPIDKNRHGSQSSSCFD